MAHEHLPRRPRASPAACSSASGRGWLVHDRLAAFARLVPPDRRSWAMGLATAAGSMGQFLFAPLGQSFICAYGPVTALMLLSCSLLLVPLLAGALTGRARRGARRRGGDLDRAGARAAVSHPSYLLLLRLLRLRLPHRVHLRAPPALPRRPGFSPGLAAWALALIGLFNVIGAYTSGSSAASTAAPAAQRHLPRARGRVRDVPRAPDDAVRSCSCSPRSIGLLWLSTVPLTSGLVALMFGTRHVGMLFGVVFLSHQIGAFIGACWAGGL